MLKDLLLAIPVNIGWQIDVELVVVIYKQKQLGKRQVALIKNGNDPRTRNSKHVKFLNSLSKDYEDLDFMFTFNYKDEDNQERGEPF